MPSENKLDEIQRLVKFINGLSPHNLDRGITALQDYIKSEVELGRIDELEKIKAIRHLPLLTPHEFVEDISNHIEKRLSELQSKRGK